MTYQVHQRDAEIKGMKIGEEQGLRKGRLEGVRMTAWNLLNMGTPENVVLAATGLTARDLDELRKNPPAMQSSSHQDPA